MIRFNFPRQSSAVQAKLYDFVEALRIAESKLTQASECFVEGAGDHGLDAASIDQIHATAKLFVSVFQEHIGPVPPSVPDKVFFCNHIT